MDSNWWRGSDADWQDDSARWWPQEDWAKGSSPEIIQMMSQSGKKEHDVAGAEKGPSFGELLLGREGAKKCWPKGKGKGNGIFSFQGECHWC